MWVVVGQSYLCDDGWVRRVLELRDDRGLPEVRYASRLEAESDDEYREQATWHPLAWFASKAIRKL